MHFYVTHPLHLKEEIQYLNPRIACHFLREGGGSEGEGIHRIWRLEREGGTKKGNFGVFWICNCIHPPFFYFHVPISHLIERLRRGETTLCMAVSNMCMWDTLCVNFFLLLDFKDRTNFSEIRSAKLFFLFLFLAPSSPFMVRSKHKSGGAVNAAKETDKELHKNSFVGKKNRVPWLNIVRQSKLSASIIRKNTQGFFMKLCIFLLGRRSPILPPVSSMCVYIIRVFFRSWAAFKKPSEAQKFMPG